MSDAMTLSPREAAKRLGIGLTTIYRLLRAGKLRAVRVGTRPNFRIPVRALEKALAEPEQLSLEAEDQRSG